MVVVAKTSGARQVEARRAIEALRAGVPNRAAVVALGAGHPAIEEAFRHHLSEAREAGPAEREPSGFLVAGNFGTGKSHLLEYLRRIALGEGFVVSKVVISKETPLHDPVKLYRAAIRGAVAPGRVGAALTQVAAELSFDSPAYRDFSRWVESPAAGLNRRFAATTYLHETARQQGELLERIIAFWSGDPIGIGELKRALKEHGVRGGYAIDPVSVRDLAYQRFRFAARLMLTAGFAGWVLLLDEVDLVARYTITQRAKSYAEMARWTGQIRGDGYPGITTVMAITSAYESEILEERNDREAVPGKLRAGRREADAALAGQAEKGMALIGRALKLTPPGAAVLGAAHETVRGLYAEAYGWQPPAEGAVGERLASTSMREYVRRWINEWDLMRLFPAYRPETEVREVGFGYGEDLELEGSEGDEVRDDEAMGLTTRGTTRGTTRE